MMNDKKIREILITGMSHPLIHDLIAYGRASTKNHNRILKIGKELEKIYGKKSMTTAIIDWSKFIF